MDFGKGVDKICEIKMVKGSSNYGSSYFDFGYSFSSAAKSLMNFES